MAEESSQEIIVATAPNGTLHDWFAAQAIIGILMKNSTRDSCPRCGGADAAVTLAFKIADKMMDERQRPREDRWRTAR